MTDEPDFNPWAVSVMVPVRFKVGVSMDEVQRQYYDQFGTLPDGEEAFDYLKNVMSYEDLKEGSSMFEAVDDEFAADYDVLENGWFSNPMQLIDGEGEVLCEDDDFDDWRDE